MCVSDGNMDDQELNEPQNRVALLTGIHMAADLLDHQQRHLMI